MKRILEMARRVPVALQVALAVVALVAGTGMYAQSQVYPSQTPTYLPNPLLAPAVIPTGTTSTQTFQTNGVGNLFLRISGSPSGLSATIQGTEARNAGAGAINWTSLSADTMGGVRVSTITAAGLYRVNVAGYATIRLNVSALTSGVTYASWSAGNGEAFLNTLPSIRATYSAFAIIGTGATTHFLSMAGSASKTVRVTHAECSGKATAALAVNITAEVDSTADTGDAGTAVTATPHDNIDAAATATVLSHTTSPTPGVLTGNIRTGTLALVVAATPITPANVLSWDFGNRPGAQEVVLRGVANTFSLDTSTAFGTAAAVTCGYEWTEE
jgi:hypothetical protein